MSKKKKYFILLFVAFVLSAITAGIYLFVNPTKNELSSYRVDKYSDLINWCDTSTKDGTLLVDCKALLLNIDSNSCFEVQVINRNRELKNLTTCEKDNSITYSNEILEYKKLMPVKMEFSYTKEGHLENYSFNHISFLKLDNTYIQGIVNEDITKLLAKNPNDTNIKNSINFCPQADSLPSYVTNENRNLYKEYYDFFKMKEISFTYGNLYDLGSENLNLIFGCESQLISGYTKSCSKLLIDIPRALETVLQSRPNNIKSGQDFKKSDISFLKQISVLYDGEEFFNFSNKADIVKALVTYLNTSSNISEELYCSTYKLLDQIDSTNQSVKNYTSYMKDTINKDIADIQSGLCRGAIDTTKIDSQGLYLESYYKSLNENSDFSLINTCINLASIIN